ncbi:MAG: phosphoesterase [Alphaproteobacteria bacterium]|nr:phosphoesterase [Alphaproteobacteria bacterium]
MFGSAKYGVLLCAILATVAGAQARPAMPRYDHIFVVIDENKSADAIIGNKAAPEINSLAKVYGLATRYYAVSHPSEPNYVALIGGDTFGIADDDAYYCKPKTNRPGCGQSGYPTYVDHTIDAPNLAQQLDGLGISWKGYFESLPQPGSPAYIWPTPKQPVNGVAYPLYAVKHNGFMNFKSVQDDPRRAQKIVGFDALYRDIAAGTLPHFAYIVPNLCNDMHGVYGHDAPSDCSDTDGLITSGDQAIKQIVDKIMHSAAWLEAGNAAIVITFDESDDDRPDIRATGCCGSGAHEPGSPGGGWVATIVATNHGPRHLIDATPYNHYSLLRTIEAGLGIHRFVGHAADIKKGVVSMTPLFAVAKQ